jgi:hypothetical protein
MARTTWLDNSWLEAVLLLGAARRAATLSDEARARTRPWAEAAQARFRVARELRDAATQRVALGLLKDAAFFALCALQAARSPLESPPRSAAEAFQCLDTLAEPPRHPPEQLAFVRTAFESGDPLALDRLSARAADELRLAAEVVVAWLLASVEVRTVRELARARVVRAALALVGFVVVVWGLISYSLSLAALAPR